MREILFRGKIKETDFENIPSGWGEQDGDWVEGLYRKRVECTCNNYECCECDGFDQHLIYVEGIDDYPIDPETVGQYTGLCDKNGKKIFEGDIIQFRHKDDYAAENHIAAIKWQGNYPAFDIDYDHDFDCNALQKILMSGDYNYLIIGNIHDNPELLEAKTNGNSK